MKTLFVVLLLALCAVVFNSNKSQAQEDEKLPSWTVTVHGEYGMGLITGATVKLFNSNNNQVFGTVTSSSAVDVAGVFLQISHQDTIEYI